MFAQCIFSAFKHSNHGYNDAAHAQTIIYRVQEISLIAKAV